MATDPILLAVDQGSSSSRCLAFDTELRIRGSHTVPISTMRPAPGFVEHDPAELVDSVRSAVAGALADGGLDEEMVETLSIANQTETFVVWDSSNGKPVYPAISWQCRRAADDCARLAADGAGTAIRDSTGLTLDPMFAASKLAWLLDEVPGARAAAERGRLLFGDVGSWLVYRLSGGRTHVTDASNAGRTMLATADAAGWDERMLGLFRVPESMMPRIVDSDADLGLTAAGLFGRRLRLAGLIGDQQASLFGQRCWTEGMVKLTLGTGAFTWANAGHRSGGSPPGVNRSCAWRLGGRSAYGDEVVVSAAGALVEWLVRTGLLDSAEGIDRLPFGDTLGSSLIFVPPGGSAEAGQGPEGTGCLAGIDLGTTPGHIAAAALNGLADRIADSLQLISASLEIDLLRVDGGLARSRHLVELIAAVSGMPIQRSRITESSALGAAMIGGLATGRWRSPEDIPGPWDGEEVRPLHVSRSSLEAHRRRWASVKNSAEDR